MHPHADPAPACPSPARVLHARRRMMRSYMPRYVPRHVPRYGCACRLYETFHSPRRIYLVLELAEGGELLDAIAARGTYCEADAARCVHQLCEALAYMHGLGVVHSDLKPSNLLLASRDPDAPLKVTDFGLGSVVLGPTTHAALGLVGTPDYMPPEALRGEKHTAAVDMWATGVILYVLLKGEPPFTSAIGGMELLFRRVSNVC